MSGVDNKTSSPSSSTILKKTPVTSCCECRRLKLKCDRVFPCSACIRRGCANLCPRGTLEKGKRGFLRRLEQSLPSNTGPSGSPSGEQSSEVAMFVARDAAMSERIKELEEVLNGAGIPIPGRRQNKTGKVHEHARGLSSEVPSPPTNPVVPTDMDHSVSPSSIQDFTDTVDVALGFGTLTIDTDNRSRYIGPSGASAYLSADLWKSTQSCMQSRRNSQESLPTRHPASNSDYLLLPPTLASSKEAEAKILTKIACLPSLEEAKRLSELYYENATFVYEIIPKTIFFSRHLPSMYPSPMDFGPRKPLSLHVIALVGIVLALGQFFDLNAPLSSVTAKATEYYDLAVLSLNAGVPVDGGLKLDTIQGVQAVHLMVLYQLSTRGNGDGESAWQLLGIAMRSIQAQGIHRDGSRWGLPPTEVEERRRVFWETHTYDRLSFFFGRPYAQNDAHFDCEMPQTSDNPLPSDVDPTNSTFSHTRFNHQRFHFATLLGHIVDLAFSAKDPTYSVIMQLDRELNEFYMALPSWILCPAVTYPVKQLPPTSARTIDGTGFATMKGLGREEDKKMHGQIYSFANMVFMTVLHLHRGPFCRALMLSPKELVQSPYESSIVSLVGAARAIINISRGIFSLQPALASRTWYFIFHSFTAVVCLSVFVIVAPFHQLAPLAFESMQEACELFERTEGDRAHSAAARVSALAAKASKTMAAYRCASQAHMNQNTARCSYSSTNIRGRPEDLLGASTKLVRVQQKEPDDMTFMPMTPPSLQHNMPPLRSNHSPSYCTQQSSSGWMMDAAWADAVGQIAGSGQQFSNIQNVDALLNPFIFNWKTDFNMDIGGHGRHMQDFEMGSSSTGMNPSHHLNVDGFDLSNFIQNGADAWMFTDPVIG